jgi:regulator of RNase E activity RraA
VLVAGSVRDVDELRDSPVSVFASSRHAMGATGNAAVVGVDESVTIGAVGIDVGDVVVGDGGGVVRLLREEAPQLLADGEHYAAAETRVLADIDAGVSLASAYEHKREVRRRIAEQ